MPSNATRKFIETDLSNVIRADLNRMGRAKRDRCLQDGKFSGTCPVREHLVRALREWHRKTPYQASESWVFASPVNQGRWPYLAQELMRHHIRPVARKLGITKRIGWHTFRHTYSTLLRSTGAELKITQELLRHSTIRVTLDTYTQAVTTEKRNAQDAVVALLFPQKMRGQTDQD